MLTPVLRALVLGLTLLIAIPTAGAVPPHRIDPSQGGVLRAHGQDEPGGFRLEPSPPPGPPNDQQSRPVDPGLPRTKTRPEPTYLPNTETADAHAKSPTPGYVCLGLGVALGLVGAVFAANSVAAMSDFPSVKNGFVDDDFEMKLEEAQTSVLVNGLLTSVFLSASVSSFIAGTMYLVTD